MPRTLPDYEHPGAHTAGVTTPKINLITKITPTETQPDESIRPEALRWFRRDDLVRKCTILNAAFATLASGFDTELTPIDTNLTDEEKQKLTATFAYVKTYVDQINRQVNLDNILFLAQIKRSLYGQSAFEIITDKKDNPSWLLSLQSDRLKPDGINSDWKLESLTYNGNPKQYNPEDLLLFTNLQLENDYIGISDVEPIFSQCRSRHDLIKRDFPKVTKRLWAPYSIHQADTSSMTSEEEDTFMASFSEKANAGESLVTNKSVTSTVVDMHIDLASLILLKQNLEQDIISNYGTPRFLLNRPTENRATAYTEFEAYVSGPLAMIQRYFKRELESQWYPTLVKLALKANNFVGDVPVKISHKWRVIRASDTYLMGAAVAQLYNNGLGIIGDHPEIGFEMMGWDKKILEPKPTTPQTTAPKTEQQNQEETVTSNE